MLGQGRPSAQGAQSPQACIRSDPLLLGVMAEFISTAFLVGLEAETMSSCHHTPSLRQAVL